MPINRLVDGLRLIFQQIESGTGTGTGTETKKPCSQLSDYGVRGFVAVAFKAARSAFFWSGRRNIRTARLI